MLQFLLSNHGLSPKEAEVYLVLVRYGMSNAADIARKSNITRTLVYALIENLVQKGFIDKITRNRKTFFCAKEYDLFEKRAAQKLEESKELVETLRNIQIVENKPEIRMYSGLEGVEQMLNTMLDESKELEYILQIRQEAHFDFVDPKKIIGEFIEKRVKYRIPVRMLCSREFKKGVSYFDMKRNDKELREVKWVEEDELDVDCTTYVFGDSVAFISLGENLGGYIITNPNIANLNRRMFFALWNRLE
ncbi:MAG: helix-turn-helix domain-containing protein [Candidatus Gracilibacteria bacterium]|nr:helix-turn-helix domain-containing protein [Candidatus Gracilibacteria bacterium]